MKKIEQNTIKTLLLKIEKLGESIVFRTLLYMLEGGLKPPKHPV